MSEIMVVQSVTKITTETPKQLIKIKVITDCMLCGIELKEEYVLEGKMSSVIDSKRLK